MAVQNFRRKIYILLMALMIFLLFIVITSHSRTHFISVYPVDVMGRLDRLELQVSNITESFIMLTHLGQNARVRESWKSQINTFWAGAEDYNDTISYDYLFNNRSKDHKTSLVTDTRCKHNLKVLILVTTHISHFSRRESIRNTWGSDLLLEQPRWKTVFLVGRTYKKEHLRTLGIEMEKFGDMIIGDIYEDFYNLTFKIQMGFEWAIKYCNFQYMLKGDDDVFVNMARLFNFLDDPDLSKTELFAGNVHYQAHVFRNGKYGVAKSEFNKNTYPRYCSGGGFVLSRDAVEKMTTLFDVVKPLKIDDAYVGVLALKCGIDVLHDNNFRMFESLKECKFNSKSIIHHPVKSKDCMEKLFRKTLAAKRKK